MRPSTQKHLLQGKNVSALHYSLILKQDLREHKYPLFRHIILYSGAYVFAVFICVMQRLAQ